MNRLEKLQRGIERVNQSVDVPISPVDFHYLLGVARVARKLALADRSDVNRGLAGRSAGAMQALMDTETALAPLLEVAE